MSRASTDQYNNEKYTQEQIDIAKNLGQNQSILSNELKGMGSDWTQFRRDKKANDMQQNLINAGWMNTKDFSMALDSNGKPLPILFTSPLGYKVSQAIDGVHTVQKPDGTYVKMTTAQLDAQNIKPEKSITTNIGA